MEFSAKSVPGSNFAETWGFLGSQWVQQFMELVHDCLFRCTHTWFRCRPVSKYVCKVSNQIMILWNRNQLNWTVSMKQEF